MIKAEKLDFAYFDKKILKDITFSLNKSSICTILGPNGSGKSTLLKVLNKLLKPQKGTVIVESEDLAQLSIKKVAKKIAYLPQENELSFAFSVFDIVLAARAHNVGFFSMPSKQDIQITQKALLLAGIENLKDKIYAQLSGGQKRLVLIARALAQKAKVLLFDEPTNHLDFANQYVILNTIKNLVKENDFTVIVTLHDPNLALFFSDFVIMIKNGQLIKYGPTKEVMSLQNLSELYDIKIAIIEKCGKFFILPEEIL